MADKRSTSSPAGYGALQLGHHFQAPRGVGAVTGEGHIVAGRARGDGPRSGGPLAEQEKGQGQEEGRGSSSHLISNTDTIIHMLKGYNGPGVLAMPNAIKNSGLLVGSLGLVCLATLCTHCMHLLVNNSQHFSKQTGRPFLSYAEVAEISFASSSNPRLKRLAPTAKAIINTFLCLTCLGVCCVYFVWISQNMVQIFQPVLGHVNSHVYMAAVLPPMLGLASVTSLKYLAPISMIANLFMFLGQGIVFSYIFQDLPYTWDSKLFASWGQLPLAFGTAIYAFEGIGVVLPLENQMRTPSSMAGWNGVLNTSMGLVSCLYVAVGFFGYLKYGEAVSGSITLNLPVGELLAILVKVLMSLAVFFTYALQLYVPVEILLPWVQSRIPFQHQLKAELCLRFLLVVATFSLAALVPRLDLFISLVGSVSISTLALMAPAVIDTVTQGGNCSRWRATKNAAIFLIGFLGFLTGSYVSLRNIFTFFLTGED